MALSISPFRPIMAPVNVTAATAAATTALDTGSAPAWATVRIVNKSTDADAYVRFTSSATAGTTTTNGIFIGRGSRELLGIPAETTHVDVIRADSTDALLQFVVGSGI